MPRSKALDSDIKNNLYYYIYNENVLKDYPQIDCILKSVSHMIEQYFKEHQKTANYIFSKLHISKDSLSKKLIQDVVFNLYEHIRILEITYHSDDVDELKELGVIRRSKYLKEKYDNNQKKKNSYYKKFIKDTDEGKNCSYSQYKTNITYISTAYYIYKFSSMYYDYIFRTVNNINFVDKEYAGILDYFYASSTNRIRKQLKMYNIWDVNNEWLPEIQNLYNSCKTTLQLHLIERLYGVITATKIYKSKHDFEYICFANTIQPLTLFGWGDSLKWLVGQYNASKYNASKYDDYTKAAEFLFNALSFAFKNVLYGVLRKLMSLNTNTRKTFYIDELYNEYEDEKCKEILSKACQNYKEFIPLKIKDISDKFMELYKDILFNGKFKIYASESILYFLNYRMTHNICDEDDDLNDDLDDDLDDEYYIEDLDISFTFDDCQGTIEHYFDSMVYNIMPEKTKKEDDDDEDNIYSFLTTIKKAYIDFGFADYLYLITELSYKEFYQKDI